MSFSQFSVRLFCFLEIALLFGAMERKNEFLVEFKNSSAVLSCIFKVYSKTVYTKAHKIKKKAFLAVCCFVAVQAK